MLNVTGLNHFYYVHDFIDMRCKHSRVLSIIRKRLHKEPSDGDVFIVMSRNRTVFKNIFNGCRDYVNMVPDKILWLPANVKYSKGDALN